MSISQVGILGAGQMGSGIAQVFSRSGYHVCLYDLSDERLQRARVEIAHAFERHIAKGSLTAQETEASLARLHLTGNYQELSDCGLIVEATTEDEAVKIRVLGEIIPFLGPKAIIASNTSSFSITRLAAATDRPDRFIGTHFMKPVAVMQLVEIIRGIATSDETFETVRGVIKSLGKESVVAEDYPAFIVNRILLPMINEAITALYEGVASVEGIDTAMKLGAHHPMGPLELADFMGLDRVLSMMRVLHEGFAENKYRPCPLLVKYVEAGWIGKLAGRGFYDYSGAKPVPTR